MSDASASDAPRAVPLGAGRYRIADGSRQRIAYVAVIDRATWVFLEGQVHVIEPPAGGRSARGDDEIALAAPMPATVLNVLVTAGQAVRQGDVIVMLEAMKMELPVKAPRDATVKAVRCRAGELVQPGVLLVELE